MEEALDRILAKMNPLGSEFVSISETEGRVVSESLIAGISLPPWDNSAMDGYAVKASDLISASAEAPAILKCLGESPAGSVSDSIIVPGTCLRVFTGSPMPQGADAVVMQEDTRTLGESDEHVLVLDSVRPFESVRFKGEDVKEGDALVSPGTRVSGFQVSLAMATGLQRCSVHCRPRVGILATGSELCEPGQPLTPGGIYESNRILLKSLVQRAGCEPVVYPIVEDSIDYDLNGTTVTSTKITWYIEDEYAKVDQSVISFSLTKKTSLSAPPIEIKVLDIIGASGIGNSGDGEGLLGLPGFEFIITIFSIIFISFYRREV